MLATGVSFLSLGVSSIVAYAEFYKVTRGEVAVVTWEKPITDDKQQMFTKVTAVISNTGDEQFMLLAAGSRALVPNAPPTERHDQTWRGPDKYPSEGADRVIVEPGEMKLVSVYVPTTIELRKLKFNSELSSKLHDPDCGTDTHYTVVIDAMILGIDGKYRGGHSPKMCFYVDQAGKVPKIRRFTSNGGPFTVLPFESFTF